MTHGRTALAPEMRVAFAAGWCLCVTVDWLPFQKGVKGAWLRCCLGHQERVQTNRAALQKLKWSPTASGKMSSSGHLLKCVSSGDMKRTRGAFQCPLLRRRTVYRQTTRLHTSLWKLLAKREGRGHGGREGLGTDNTSLFPEYCNMFSFTKGSEALIMWFWISWNVVAPRGRD